MTTHAICVWDFSIPADAIAIDDLKAKLQTIAKKWTFQLEEGADSQYKHYQGRMSLGTKARLNTVKDRLGINRAHLTATSNANRDNTFYVTKEETRLSGPWSDTDQYIPLWLRSSSPQWYPWQATVLGKISAEPETRELNIIWDPRGNQGKTYLAYWLAVRGEVINVPAFNDVKDMMRVIMAKDKKKCYIFDLPRATDKKFMHNFVAAMELLKNGYAFEDRYEWTDSYFDPPHIWIFSNKKIDRNLLSSDRWRYWRISSSRKLKPILFEDEED